MSNWFTITPNETIGIIFSVVLIYVLLMIFIRMNGLRSFAKMSSHGFAVTIAIGSILGAVTTQKDPSVLQGALAIMTLFGLQSLYSVWRRNRPKPYLENTPILLMDGPVMLKENMKIAKISSDDLYAKLREANVLNLSEVKAVVLELSGDISVLHGDSPLQQDVLQGVELDASQP